MHVDTCNRMSDCTYNYSLSTVIATSSYCRTFAISVHKSIIDVSTPDTSLAVGIPLEVGPLEVGPLVGGPPSIPGVGTPQELHSWYDTSGRSS